MRRGVNLILLLFPRLRTAGPRLFSKAPLRTFTNSFKNRELRLPNLRLVPPPRTPALFARLRFEPAIEAAALEQLSRLEFASARETLARLAGQLDLGAPGVSASEVVLLLADVLQRVNRRLHRSTEADAAGALNRADLVARFAPIVSPESAREVFLSELDKLLAELRPAGGVH